MQLALRCLAVAVHLPCICNAFATQLPCSFHAFTVHLLDTSRETRREGLKTIGLKMRHGGKALKPLVETRETRRDALKPLVLRGDSPVRLQNRTSTIGSLVDGICETRRDGLKPLV